VILGRINPDFFLGGEEKLDTELAEKFMREKVADPMGLDTIEAARSVIDIANVRMTSALYFVTVQQGIDPRDYILVPSGGAGPMQAVAIAQSLGVGKVLVPPAPGVNSAVGLLATDLKHEIVRTFMTKARDADHKELSKVFGEMEAPIRDLLREEEVPDDRVEIRREIDMCYFGQSFQLRVPLKVGIDEGTAEAASAAFHDRHEAVYGFCSRGEATMFVNLRLTAIGKVDRPRLRKLAEAKGSVDRANKGKREVYFAEAGGMVPCDLYDRGKLLFGDRMEGPAIIEQMDTTTVLPPDAALLVDLYGNLEITVRSGDTL
jgi:N-methylhydantoinase A